MARSHEHHAKGCPPTCPTVARSAKAEALSAKADCPKPPCRSPWYSGSTSLIASNPAIALHRLAHELRQSVRLCAGQRSRSCSPLRRHHIRPRGISRRALAAPSRNDTSCSSVIRMGGMIVDRLRHAALREERAPLPGSVRGRGRCRWASAISCNGSARSAEQRGSQHGTSADVQCLRGHGIAARSDRHLLEPR